VNLRHTTALALIGWYLIAPPGLDPRTQNTGLFVDASAPVAQWEILARYASKVKCELGRRDRLFRIARAAEEDELEAEALARETAAFGQQEQFDSKKADALWFRVVLTLFREQVVQREVMSRCIPSKSQGMEK
jgi:hypothetical protein